jgi:hypothetical protein
VAWYNGKIPISHGRLSEGAGSVLWEIPNQTTFLQLRAEALPFPPIGSTVEASGKDIYPDASWTGNVLKGKARTVSLPVSSKGEIPGALAPLLEKHEDVLHYYRFSGDLQDSLNSLPAGDILPLSPDYSKPLWLPAGYVYGLAVGGGDMYRLPVDKGEHFLILLSFKSLQEGVFFTVYPGNTSAMSPSLELSREGEQIVLELTSGDLQERIFMDIPSGEEFITLAAEFTIGLDPDNRFISAVLGEEEISLEYDSKIKIKEIFLELGKLGKIAASEKNLENDTELKDTASAEQNTEPEQNTELQDVFGSGQQDPNLPVIILNELALIRLP